MSFFLWVSIAIRLVTLGWSLTTMLRLKEWKTGLFSIIVGLLAAQQILTMFGQNVSGSVSILGHWGELPGLLVSITLLIMAALMGGLINNDRGDIESVDRSARIFDLQQAVQRKMIDGASLKDTLSELCTYAERVFPGAIASVLLLEKEKNRLRFVAGPNIPGDLALELDGLVPGPASGSCGVAAFTGETTIVSDIASDSRWAGLQELAKTYSLNACWSIPIVGEGTRVLGTFALSFSSSCRPTESHHKFLQVSSDLASIAIQKLEAQEKQARLSKTLEAARRMQSMAVLAGGVAHDLNNMLGPLVGYPDMILRQLPESSKGRKQLKIMARAVRQAASVIQDLLTLARRGRYEMGPLHLETIVNSYFESPAFDEAQRVHPRVDVICDLNLSDGSILGSETHLTKLVMNLVNNAFEAMPAGGTLKIGTCRKHVGSLLTSYSGFVPGEYLVLTVSDTGIGIDSSDIARIFEPYFSRKKLGRGGSGLGLSVVRGVIKDHNGFYDVVSNEGEGTEFLLYFPMASERECADAGDPSELTPMEGRERLLVVDDEESQRVMAESLLESLGYCVTTVASGEAAIRKVSAGHFDLVIMDMILDDGLDGLDTYEAILKVCPQQKAIATSGYSATERVSRMQDLGAGEFVAKPYTLATISTAVRQELDRSVSATRASAVKL